ncbi:MAG: hypothetical protein K6F46_11670 [Desulfovibrio sp.]|nr:hypothetical protein [Desulfovibrio sp.]
MIHALITLTVCFAIALLDLPFWMCAFPAVWYMGREYTQAEYRWIDEYGDGKRENMPWYAPLTPAAWTVKGMLDWILPSLVSVSAMMLMKVFGTNAA